MTNKIDISSLAMSNVYTKNKIEQMHKRCEELYKGIKVDLIIRWTEGTECDIVGLDIDEIKNEINKEIDNIINFSNSIADQLGVDRDEFFQQYFAA